MIGFLKGLAGWKMQLIIAGAVAASAFGMGYYTSTKFHQAAQLKALQGLVDDLAEDAQNKLNTQHANWMAALGEGNALLIKAAELRGEDSERESVILESIEESKNEIRAIRDRVLLVSDVGICRLDDEFIRLWNDISKATNANLAPTGSGHP